MNCSQLYIGLDIQLQESESELFSIMKRPSGSDECKRIHKVLGTKHIYYLAPHTGCGCGWEFLDVDSPSDEMSQKSCELLERFLADLESKHISAKLYSVCIDSIGLAPEREDSVTADDFMLNINEYRAPYSSNVAKVFRLGT